MKMMLIRSSCLAKLLTGLFSVRAAEEINGEGELYW